MNEAAGAPDPTTGPPGDGGGAAFTLGVEEEYQLIDPATRNLRASAAGVLAAAQPVLGEAVQPELRLSQIEIATPVCQTLAEVRRELLRLRGAVIAAAAREGSRVASAGTHPFAAPPAQPITPEARYQGIARTYRQLADELVIFGCHVHVGIADLELAIATMNRARVWLAPLVALAASSPFWNGADTGYASYRTELWGRWPLAGPPHAFASRAEYDAVVRALVATETITEATQLYWDIRPSARFPTLEFRATDACPTVDEAVLVAGLTRALARTCYEAARRGAPFPDPRPELLRAAHWRAARDGLEGTLVDPATGRPVPAPDLIGRFLDFVRAALEDLGEWEEVAALVQATLRGGNGASRQRTVYRRAGRWEEVVDLLVAETARGVATV
jgi:carboxylate-amine ligase